MSRAGTRIRPACPSSRSSSRIRALWNEIIGFVFLCLAAAPDPPGLPSVAAIQRDRRGTVRGWRSTSVFIVLMATFGIHSFLRARKISRS